MKWVRTHEGLDFSQQLVPAFDLWVAHFNRLLAFLLLFVTAEHQSGVNHGDCFLSEV